MAKLTPEKIEEINKVYKEIGTYSGTAKIVGCSPASVKKYVSEDFVPDTTTRVLFDGTVPPVEEIVWPSQEKLNEMGRLTEEEMAEMQELWKEL